MVRRGFVQDSAHSATPTQRAEHVWEGDPVQCCHLMGYAQSHSTSRQQPHVRDCKCTIMCTHVHTLIHTHTSILSLTHTHTHTHNLSLIHSHTQTFYLTHLLDHLHTHTHTHTHTLSSPYHSSGRPASDGGSSITSYEIQRRPTEEGEWESAGAVPEQLSFSSSSSSPSRSSHTPSLTHTLTHLTPGMQYEVRVSCRNSVGVSELILSTY